VDDDLISEDEARGLFAPHFSLIVDCLLAGWTAWAAVRATPEGRRLGKSARARIVWDHATAKAEELFEDVRGIGRQRRHGLLILDFVQALMRFKKLDNSLRMRGIPTGQQQLFANQEQVAGGGLQLSLWSPVPMVVAGYVLDRLETGIERLVLVLIRGSRVVWQIDLPQSDEAPVALPIDSTGPTPATPRSTRPKRTEQAEAE
jgi:hypothetical protein